MTEGVLQFADGIGWMGMNGLEALSGRRRRAEFIAKGLFICFFIFPFLFNSVNSI